MTAGWLEVPELRAQLEQAGEEAVELLQLPLDYQPSWSPYGMKGFLNEPPFLPQLPDLPSVDVWDVGPPPPSIEFDIEERLPLQGLV